jgi:putative RecB family exonuclease
VQATPAHLPELLTLFETELERVPFQGRKEREQGLARGRQILTQYLHEEGRRSAEIAQMEVERKFAIDLGGEVVLEGKIDRVDVLASGQIRIVDYKTGKLGTRPDYLRGFQMPIYAWAVQRVFGKPLHSVEVIGLKELDEKKEGPVVPRQVLPWAKGQYALTQDRLDDLERRVGEITRGVRSGAFATVPEQQRCGWCAYRLLCDRAWGTNGE